MVQDNLISASPPFPQTARSLHDAGQHVLEPQCLMWTSVVAVVLPSSALPSPFLGRTPTWWL